MMKTVTPEMREYVTDKVEETLVMRKRGYDPIVLPDDIITLIYRAAEIDPDATIDSVIDETVYLMMDYCEQRTIREYLALRQYFKDDDNMMTRLMLLLGLHHPERNREGLNVQDPTSIQRNAALLSAINLLRTRDYGNLLAKATTYSPPTTHHMEQGISDEALANLIIDHPQHWQTLIATMQERGYEAGMEVFRESMTTNAPALLNGAL